MIHVFLGTKAQLIKMAPIMREMQARNISYNFIFSGQHQKTIADIRQNFNIKEPDIILYQGKDITGMLQMAIWSIKIIFFTLSNKKRVWKNDKKGIVLNHGDTFSTLLGSILAKSFGFQNAHIESGLRSFRCFHPFPEELIRLAVFKLSNVYFAPDKWALKNLDGYKGMKVNTQANTLYDSLQIIKKWSHPPKIKIPDYQYAIVSLHRFENISRKKSLNRIISLLDFISKDIKLLFITHAPTLKWLEKTKLIKKLEAMKNIELRPRYDYHDFISLVIKSEFVITDGGSNQEECYYLGKPCLLFRKATERNEGLGKNVILSRFDKHIIQEFTSNYNFYRRNEIQHSVTPSKIIIDTLQTFESTQSV